MKKKNKKATLKEVAPIEKVEELPKPAENLEYKPDSAEITVEPQADNIVKEPFVSPEPQPEKPQATVRPELTENSHFALAKAIHGSLNNIIGSIFKHKFSIDYKIDDGSLQLLNEYGAKIISKYDANGDLREIPPEMLYLITLVGIGSDIWLMWQEKAEKEVAKSETVQPASNRDN